MTIFLDSTAFFSHFTIGSEADLVRGVLGEHPSRCVSAVTLTECQMLLRGLDLDPRDQRRLRGAIVTEWESFHVVPVDPRCLERASEIGLDQPVRTIDAIQLAAADRLPRPLTFVTFDPNQIGPALDLGFEVVSTLTTR